MVGLMFFMMLSTFGLVMFIVMLSKQNAMYPSREITAGDDDQMRQIAAAPEPEPQIEYVAEPELSAAELSDRWTQETAALYRQDVAANPEHALRDAKRLHEDGLISEDDYAALRKRILGI